MSNFKDPWLKQVDAPDMDSLSRTGMNVAGASQLEVLHLHPHEYGRLCRCSCSCCIVFGRATQHLEGACPGVNIGVQTEW